ncbi:MAG: right-handed parallel beta-helix repeat-containing protein [Paludibacter sp.]|nr:right-handed parallel beta-helix repeat-containing protein [Paludibacter sp.]
MKRYLSIIFAFCFLFHSENHAKTYFVSVNGNDTTNVGTVSAPFATIMRAQQYVSAGDTVYIRGGIYKMKENQIAERSRIWVYVHALTKSGTPGKFINYWAYPKEHPVFDLANVKPADKRVIAFNVTGSWIHIKGLEVIHTQVTIKTHTQSECFHNEGSNNVYEQLSMHDGQAIGFFLTKGSNNLILNCDAYRNWDYTSEGGRGGNADGFGCHPQPEGKGNIFRGCRAWFNSDDGYDCIRSYESVTFDHCWAFYNGYSTDFKSLGDGNGFKAGGWGLVKDRRVPDSIPMHVVQFCLAVKNKANGFYSNHQPGGSYWYNNTACYNGTNFNMLNRDKDFSADVSGYNHTLTNNLSFAPKTYETQWIDTTKCRLKNNSFSIPLQVSKSDFESLDESQLVAPRKADGSLPDITFMHLKKGSKLIDKGADIGFKFSGKKPDLGAFEY